MYRYVVKYNYGITDGMTVDMCVLFAASGMVHYWMNVYCSMVFIYCLPMLRLYRYRCICVHVHVILYHYTYHM